ncbi:hypothetical protein [Paenibacillus sp. FSL R7-0331]|nr:hypothetical protein [Paenibacillus sp. FSL R7-0331]
MTDRLRLLEEKGIVTCTPLSKRTAACQI